MKSILLALGILTSLQGFSDELISQEELLTVPIEEKTQTEPIQKEIPPWLNQLWIIPGFVSFYLLGKESKVTNPKIEFHPKIKVTVDHKGNTLSQEQEGFEDGYFNKDDKDLAFIFSIQDPEHLGECIKHAPTQIFVFMRKLMKKELNSSVFVTEIMDYIEREEKQTYRQMQKAYDQEGYRAEELEYSEIQDYENIIMKAFNELLTNTENLFKVYYDEEYHTYLYNPFEAAIIKKGKTRTPNEKISFLERLLLLEMTPDDNTVKGKKPNLNKPKIGDEVWAKLIDRTYNRMTEDEKFTFLTRTTGLFYFLVEKTYPEAPFFKHFTEAYSITNHSNWLRQLTQKVHQIQKNRKP